MDKKKQSFALLMFAGMLLNSGSLLISSDGSNLRDFVQGVMAGAGIAIMLLSIWTFAKNKGFKDAK
ncbi:hypothetical protein [Paenibacillus sp. sgz5001063]|uniref:hypothetical protein n=1 Tax=Paenibacillus sp. sgz5001063 TaxID=3242474 RepID=UPI0036D3B4A8